MLEGNFSFVEEEKEKVRASFARIKYDEWIYLLWLRGLGDTVIDVYWLANLGLLKYKDNPGVFKKRILEMVLVFYFWFHRCRCFCLRKDYKKWYYSKRSTL